MSLFIFLTVIQALVAAALVAVVLMQRSEGGGLGIGGSSTSGGIGARGAADFLSRSTKWLAVAFVVLSIVLAALAVRESSVSTVTSTLERGTTAPAGPDLLADPVAPTGEQAPATPNPAASDDPLAE